MGLLHYTVILFTFITSAVARADYVSYLIETAHHKNLAANPQWLNLLHYKPGFFGGYKSQADGAAFFLSPEGKNDPRSELESTIRAFFDPTRETEKDNESFELQHPQCRFPARYAWLSAELGFDPAKLIRQSCPRYERFKKNLSAKSATLVFSSYYLNNPASAFGHSFLRLNKTEVSQKGERYELLDYGVSYAAVVTTNNPLAYVFSGIFGFFDGRFSTIPYYAKVREYNDSESRDLWEYDLSLTRKQVELLVAHLWELTGTRFDYFYFDENCSYHVLGLLDAANPELKLTSRLSNIVIPSETVKVIHETPGLVVGVKYRPSSRVQFYDRIGRFSGAQLGMLDVRIKDPNFKESDFTQLSERERVEVLDAAVDFVAYKYPAQSQFQWKQRLLRERSRLRIPSDTPLVVTPSHEMPHLGHGARRTSLGYGYLTRSRSGYAELGLRYALHDLLDPAPGYPDYAHIEMGSARMRYHFKPRNWRLEDLALVQITSLAPVNRFERPLSWKMRLGARTVRDFTCEACFAGQLSGGVGYTVGPLVAMLDAELAGSPDFDRFPLRPGVGPSLGIRWAFFPSNLKLAWRQLAHATYRFQFPTRSPHFFEFGLESRFVISGKFGLNAKVLHQPRTTEVSTGVLYYF